DQGHCRPNPVRRAATCQRGQRREDRYRLVEGGGMNKQSTGDRAVAGLIRYESAAAELTRIKKAIVTTLEQCPITIEAYKEFDDKSPLWDKSRVNHHLHKALSSRGSDGYGLDQEEITDQLTGWDDESEGACSHCLAAWGLILSRKGARQEFGNAKRLVRALGKQAWKAAPWPAPASCPPGSWSSWPSATSATGPATAGTTTNAAGRASKSMRGRYRRNKHEPILFL